MSDHMRRMSETKWEHRACMEIRKHFTHYLHGFEGVKEYRKRLSMTQTLAETEVILKELSGIDVLDHTRPDSSPALFLEKNE